MKIKEVLTIRHLKEQALLSKYPKIFRQAKDKCTETCMCWGLECSEGWFGLIDTLCELLQFDIDKNGQPQIEAAQVKEKFGGLRFYTTGTNDRQNGMIDFAERLSLTICESCGTTENVRQNKSGWIQTLCTKCRKMLK